MPCGDGGERTGGARNGKKGTWWKLKSHSPLHSNIRVASRGQRGALERGGRSEASTLERGAFGALVGVGVVETTAVDATRMSAGFGGGAILLRAHGAPSAVHRFKMAASTDTAPGRLRASCSEVAITPAPRTLSEARLIMPARRGDGSTESEEGGLKEGSEDGAIRVFEAEDDGRASTVDLLRSTCPARRLGDAEARKRGVLHELGRQSRRRVDSAARGCPGADIAEENLRPLDVPGDMVIRVELEGSTEGREMFVNAAVGGGRREGQDDVARGARIDRKRSHSSSSWNRSQCCVHITDQLGRGSLK
ncbi:uncharacterized protein LAESUDRAFT_284913, partial [Laetiporus sulphureus 93-53]